MIEAEFPGFFLVLVLVGFIGLAFAVQRFLPRLGRRFQLMGRLQALGVLTLTPQCSVALVRAGGETLVLGLTPQSVTLLTKLPAASPLESEERNGGPEHHENREEDTHGSARELRTP
jgi:flagellar biogenesis protein FliO